MSNLSDVSDGGGGANLPNLSGAGHRLPDMSGAGSSLPAGMPDNIVDANYH